MKKICHFLLPDVGSKCKNSKSVQYVRLSSAYRLMVASYMQCTSQFLGFLTTRKKDLWTRHFSHTYD